MEKMIRWRNEFWWECMEMCVILKNLSEHNRKSQNNWRTNNMQKQIRISCKRWTLREHLPKPIITNGQKAKIGHELVMLWLAPMTSYDWRIKSIESREGSCTLNVECSWLVQDRGVLDHDDCHSLQKYLRSLESWADPWRKEFNHQSMVYPAKCQVINFSKKDQAHT